MSTTNAVRLDQWRGPRPMRDLAGRVVVRFERFRDELEPPDWIASVVGWGSELVAASPDLDVLSRHVERRYHGRVAVAAEASVNPLSWPEAQW